MLILMRHGQASFGSAHYDQLSALGLEQARASGVFLRERALPCHAVCVGPRARHQATAFALVDAWGVSCERRDESDLDEFTENVRAAVVVPGPGETQADDLQLMALMRRIGAWADGDLVLPGSPTLPEFRERIGHWVRRTLSGTDKAATVMAVTSAGVVAAALCEVMDLPDSMFLPLVSQVRNASMTEIAMSRGRPVICSFNGQAHLPHRLLTVI